MRRSAILNILVGTGLVATAHAGLWETVYRGLDIVTTPSGGPLQQTGNGTLVNGQRAGRLRIVPNGVIGDGYRLEMDRSFGADSSGRPEVFRFGPYGDLTLAGSTSATAAYNRMGKLFFGEATFGVSNMNYELGTKLGAQDATLTGTLNVTNTLTVNTLGFYTLNVNVNNSNSQLVLDGVVVRDEEETNFTFGPVNINGNIFADGAALLLGSFGVEIPGYSDLFPDSIVDELIQANAVNQQGQAVVAGKTITAADLTGEIDSGVLAPLLLQTVLGQDQVAADALLSALSNENLTIVSAGDAGAVAAVPEPATWLVLFGGAILFARRR